MSDQTALGIMCVYAVSVIAMPLWIIAICAMKATTTLYNIRQAMISAALGEKPE